MWSARVVILCGHKSYSIGWIQISLGLKIHSEPVRRNLFKPKLFTGLTRDPTHYHPIFTFLYRLCRIRIGSENLVHQTFSPTYTCTCTTVVTLNGTATWLPLLERLSIQGADHTLFWTISSDIIVGSQEGNRGIIHIGLKNNFRSELDTASLPKTLRR
jgi:hypothetical protein